ncbi:sterile alpha motif domain-containing protein 15-like [Microplitis mediator]|uniref:sterile alpha motif domain-containing protein 15-like n=1 Tax=Microplitis mediator TaxID=375433 RepID=UPI002553DBA9|nr:sterile alpha motif domain-containing protein 15-like [Microplitis mediator]
MTQKIIDLDKSLSDNFNKLPDQSKPFSLKKIAGDVVNNLPMPECWDWSIQDVEDWIINDIKLPQYKDCFVRNLINGRKLFLLEARLPKIGIYDFEDIKKISKAIRELFQVEKPSWGRSICLPARYPLTMFLEYKTSIGRIHLSTTRTDYFKKIGILDDTKAYDYDGENFSKPCKFPYSCVALRKRKNVYEKIEFPRRLNKNI